ncbi:MAG: LPXTG cell wall anchor domain-containing protein, partial [Candidatus Acidiferrum sp.]
SIALMGAMLLPGNAKADAWNKATKLTFSGPVEVPGRALPAGTYWFQLMDSSSNRHIVQIWNSDRSQLLATILAIPNYRLRPTGDSVISFAERPSGSPEAIQDWFYPGDNFGQEFVYPKSRATELAQQVNAPVLETQDEQVEAPAAALEQAPVKAVQPTGDEIEIAEVVETDLSMTLPQTGSPMPLLGLLGLLSLGAGLAMRRKDTKSAAA